MSKYVKFEDATGDEFCIVFPDTLRHVDIAKAITREFHATPVSAGFFTAVQDDNDIAPYGKSETLNLESDPKRDKIMLTQCLNRNYV